MYREKKIYALTARSIANREGSGREDYREQRDRKEIKGEGRIRPPAKNCKSSTGRWSQAMVLHCNAASKRSSAINIEINHIEIHVKIRVEVRFSYEMHAEYRNVFSTVIATQTTIFCVEIRGFFVPCLSVHRTSLICRRAQINSEQRLGKRYMAGRPAGRVS